MKKLLFFLSISSNLYMNAKCVINCNIRYAYIKDESINVGTYKGSEIGETTLFAPNSAVVGQNNSNYVWSQTYNVDVTFYSGYELNQALTKRYYSDNAIVAHIEWSNGGHTMIEINNWTTTLKYITSDEVLIDGYSNKRIPYMNGYDRKNNLWEIYF